MRADGLLAALNLPPLARVDQRVPKKLLLENGAPTAADKRLINEGIEEIRWMAALKPATCGVPEFRDASREYLEIAVLQLMMRERAKTGRLVELMHRAVPYPMLLLIDDCSSASVSLVHKRHALKEANKVILDGNPLLTDLHSANSEALTAFLQALDVARQPRATLYTLYQGWLDTALALEAAAFTGVFKLLESNELATVRRHALGALHDINVQIKSLRSAAGKASQMSRQVDLNLQLQQLNRQREQALQHLQGNP